MQSRYAWCNSPLLFTLNHTLCLDNSPQCSNDSFTKYQLRTELKTEIWRSWSSLTGHTWNVFSIFIWILEWWKLKLTFRTQKVQNFILQFDVPLFIKLFSPTQYYDRTHAFIYRHEVVVKIWYFLWFRCPGRMQQINNVQSMDLALCSKFSRGDTIWCMPSFSASCWFMKPLSDDVFLIKLLCCNVQDRGYKVMVYSLFFKLNFFK